MLKNYLKIAWRNLIKGRVYSVINIVGMSVGIGICLLLSLFIQEEWSYDEFHTKSDRTYRAWVKEHFKGDIFFNSITPYPLGTELKDNFPELEQVTRYTTINSLVKIQNRIDEEEVHLADPSFFKTFDFPILNGTNDVLNLVHNVVITPVIGMKYFGDEAPLGQTLTLQVGGEWTDFTISGIVSQAPSNSSIQYGIIIPFENTVSFMSEFGRHCWTCVSVETYVVLKEGNDLIALEQNVAPFIDKKVVQDYKAGEYIIGFQPITDIHLNNDVPQGIAKVSDGRYPYILFGIALLILLLACINFTTLSIGRSINRSREVGIRKVTGATRGQLIFQFGSEAFMTVLIGILLGLTIAKIGLPFFNQLAGTELVLSADLTTALGLVALFIITGILSGFYPALVLSGFKPIDSLKGKLVSSQHSKGKLLSWLVGFQFVLSVVLLICTGVMQNQMRFLQNTNLGYNQDQIVTIPYDVSGQNLGQVWIDGKKIQQRLEDKLRGNSSILGITSSSHTFGSSGWVSLGYTDKKEERFRKFNAVQIDEDFLSLMDIDLIDGRNFSKEITTDEKAVIINQAMVNEYKLSDPIGQYLPEPFQEFKIIGVTGDFHFSSLHHAVDPLVMSYNFLPLVRQASDVTSLDSPNPKISIKLASANLPKTMRVLEDSWKEIAPNQSFAYSFMDENIDFLYKREAKLSSILTWATVLALLIACMGLFGISALKVSNKTKEIGIRKVLGASSRSILIGLSYDYLKLISIATVIAFPLAWFVMSKWLEDFAFNVGLQWWVFASAAVITVIIALLTVSFQGIKASLMNPVDSLRME
jgi:putative ABC transport system permease protein